MKSFSEKNIEYERWCDSLPGGPDEDDPYADLTDAELEDIKDRRLELAIEKDERRREARYD